MDHYKTTHKTDWRRVRWVYDHEYQGLVAGIEEDDAEAKAVAQRELEDLQAGNLVCLGAIVETKCTHCKEWTVIDDLWNIVIEPDQDLEELGSEILEIPEYASDCPDPKDTAVLEMMVDDVGKFVVTGPPPPPKGPANTLHKEGDTTPRKPETEVLPDWICRDMGLPPGSLMPTERKPKGPGLARIVLQFDPDTLAGLRSAVYVRRLTGNAGGLLDAFTAKLMDKIEAGEATWEVKQKKEVD